MATYEQELADYDVKLDEYNKIQAKYKADLDLYNKQLSDHNKAQTKYNQDLDAYNKSREAYENCLKETVTEEIVNGRLNYNLSVTGTGASGQYGTSLMQGSTSGDNFSIVYTNVVGSITVGTATIKGDIDVSYQSLGGGRIRATINRVNFHTWNNVSGNATSWYAPHNPTLVLKDAGGGVVWRMDNYDPATTRTVNINKSLTLNKSFELTQGQTVQPFIIAKIDDLWLASGYGDIKVGFTNNSTVTKRTVKKNNEATCSLLLKPRPNPPGNPPQKPTPPTVQPPEKPLRRYVKKDDCVDCACEKITVGYDACIQLQDMNDEKILCAIKAVRDTRNITDLPMKLSQTIYSFWCLNKNIIAQICWLTNEVRALKKK